MVDHRKREKILVSDTCHMFLCLQRNKDNKEVEYPTVYRQIIRDYDKDLNIMRAKIKTRTGIWRIYRTVNKRSFEKANKLFRHRLIDDLEDYYYRLDSLWKTCLLQKSSRAEKRFHIDVDDRKLGLKVASYILNKDIEVFEKPVETPNGWHFITEPFDRREIEEKFKDVEVSTDGYVFVEMIENERY